MEKDQQTMTGAISKKPVRELYGVGPSKEKLLARLDIRTVGDLLNHFPTRYENRGDIVTLAEAVLLNRSQGIDRKRAVVLTVTTKPRLEFPKKGLDLVKFKAQDESGTCEITLFNQRYRVSEFPVGSVFRFWGVVNAFGKTYTLSSPEFEPVLPGRELISFLPVYPLTAGLTQAYLRQLVSRVLRDALKCEDPLPETVRTAYGLCDLSTAVRQIHLPQSEQEIEQARKRLSFEELFYYALGVSMTRSMRLSEKAPLCQRKDLSSLTDLLPYHLTNGQTRAIKEIMDDMNSTVPMNRILVGDVGCGKTICAIAAIWLAVQNGMQAALMAPTEILAKQHYRDVSATLKQLGCRCALLTGSTKASEKKQIYEALQTDDPSRRLHVVIGTQALLSEQVEFAAPGLVVTDEQHRFGVKQRAVLASKNEHFHLLVMSATPIPRSLALILYGDLSISKINEMPPGRQRVETFVVNDSYHDRLVEFIKKTVSEGGQAYVVCPAVEESDEEDEDALRLKSVSEYTQRLAQELPGIRVDFVHGKMKNQDKEAVMESFSSGSTQVLVATTVIEVGVNVPNASLMIVENAERFGLSQLHQLRGRVGRGTRKSYCVLVSESADKKGSTAYQRLESMRTQYDGFAIAEQDLKIRGPGDFLDLTGSGTIRQSGESLFKMVSLSHDTKMLEQVRQAADVLLTEDPDLSDYPVLKRLVTKLFFIQRDTMN
ncbi:MAG: ATP-dependent DNA helicase RecG [Clostridia bacterium]|nr:ATP-dependent DNA helicase RecG [Clostridia bacterium]